MLSIEQRPVLHKHSLAIFANSEGSSKELMQRKTKWSAPTRERLELNFKYGQPYAVKS